MILIRALLLQCAGLRASASKCQISWRKGWEAVRGMWECFEPCHQPLAFPPCQEVGYMIVI